MLLPEGVELPDVVTNTIDLPKDENGEYRASEEAIAQSAKGIAIANAAPGRSHFRRTNGRCGEG